MSDTVGTPVTLVRVSPGHWSTMSPGSRSDGAVVSRTVIVCNPLALLPQPSLAVQVRVMILLPPQLLEIESEYVTVTLLHASWPLAVPVALGAVLAPHSKVKFGGTGMVARVVSRSG